MAKWPDPDSESDFEPGFEPKPSFDLDTETDFEPLELTKPLARGKASDLGDVTTIADALADLGAYDKGRHGNPPLVPETLFRSIEDFQKDQSLDVDGVMLPNGPTLGRINALLPKAKPKRVRGDGLQSPKPAPKTPASEDDDGPRFADLYRARLDAGEPQGFGPAFAMFEMPDSGIPGLTDGPRLFKTRSRTDTLITPPAATDKAPDRRSALAQAATAPSRNAVDRISDGELIGKLIAASAPSRQGGDFFPKINPNSTDDEDRLLAAWRGRIADRVRALAQEGAISPERARLLLVQFEGHHYFPQEIFNQLNLPPDARDAFRRGTTGLTERHNRDAAHIRYTEAVRDMWERWIRERGINPSQMTRAQAEDFLHAIRNSGNPTIRNFNDAIRLEQLRVLRNGMRRR